MADRIEREIEEILKKLDGVTPAKARRQARRVGQPFAAAQTWFGHRLARISMKQVMMWSLLVFLVSFFLMRAMPGATWVMVGALIVFVIAYLLSRGSAAKPQEMKRWRGQPMDLRGPTWANQIKAWIKGRRRI
jgi:hypothetical protein